jgi:hypothetical protein
MSPRYLRSLEMLPFTNGDIASLIEEISIFFYIHNTYISYYAVIMNFSGIKFAKMHKIN